MATFRGQDGSATFAAIAIANLKSWALDGQLDVIDVTVKGDDFGRVRGGLARGTAQITGLLDYATGQQDLIDFIAVATPPGTIGELILTAGTANIFTVQAMLTGFSLNDPEGSEVASVTFDFILDGAIAVS